MDKQERRPPVMPNAEVDRGDRVAKQMHMTRAHDGKQKAWFVRPKQGDLPADLAESGGPAPVTTQDVVETPPASSAWEAIEDDSGDPATPPRRGRDPARTQSKA